MSRSRKKHNVVKDKTGRWYNKLIRRRNRIEVKQIANLTDMLEYNISQPYELVNPWAEAPREYSDAMLAYKKRCNNEIDLSVEDFFKMKYVVKQNGKLLAVKHVKDSAKCGLKEAKDFVDTYCDCVQND